MRLYLGLLLSTRAQNILARAINGVIPAILTYRDLLALNMASYSKSPNSWVDENLINEGLCKDELKILKKYDVGGRRGKILVLFSGGGRDSIALAKLGFDEVVGMDFVPGIVEYSRKFTQRQHIRVNYIEQDILKLKPTEDYFDYAVAFANMYSCTPGKNNRIIMLKNIYKTLKPGGLFIASFFFAEPSQRQKTFYKVAKLLSFLTLGNSYYQYGDRIIDGPEFYHYFTSEEELVREFTLGGFDIKEIDIDHLNLCGMAVLTKRQNV